MISNQVIRERGNEWLHATDQRMIQSCYLFTGAVRSLPVGLHRMCPLPIRCFVTTLYVLIGLPGSGQGRRARGFGLVQHGGYARPAVRRHTICF